MKARTEYNCISTTCTCTFDRIRGAASKSKIGYFNSIPQINFKVIFLLILKRVIVVYMV